MRMGSNKRCFEFLSLKVVWFGGFTASILISYLESAELFIRGVEISLNSVWPLRRYYNILTQSKVGKENLNLRNSSNLMT